MTTDSFNRKLKKYCKEASVPIILVIKSASIMLLMLITDMKILDYHQKMFKGVQNEMI